MTALPKDQPAAAEPPVDCRLCPRLAEFRAANRVRHPDFRNAPVPAFGDRAGRLLIVGLAPGLKGANATGRPFTGDYAGDLLYATLLRFGWAEGRYDRRPDDGLRLIDCRITNAVRCVPPENKPVGAEVKACRGFLETDIAGMTGLKGLLALGGLSHNAILGTLGVRRASYPFGHGARHALPNGLTLFDSYHCSRYNVNTRVLTEDGFYDVFRGINAFFGRA
ncbi:uracil-DNA glycosylase [Oceanibacterium hippocampi]|uniref:Type-5 uracil-DNA glycosylase n=1 Tax=Oceanibacterium hippocampi TaxID=745714 RepID=A0A1Y5U203_9PROT|nr:uracil-DNA glycosylase [Oceanibacterium hippocampi]SLN77086.1 Uracil DNA glycosylase superfamily protein [Oceanibacterium hippocampi]